MKNFKKAISVLVAVLMLTALIPAMAQAEDIADLTIEDVVGHQPASMITESLTLPEGYTWTAEPSDVINTETGAVTRHYVNDSPVTLTATDAEGTSESFSLVVKAKTTKIYAADTFAYDYDASADALSQDGFIFTHHGDSDNNSNHIINDGENSYLQNDMTATDGTNARVRWKGTTEKMESLNSEDVIYIEFDMNYTYTGATYSIFKLEAVDSSGNGVSLAATQAGKFRAKNQDSSTGYTFTEGQWTSAAVKLDMNSKLVSVKIGDNDWVQNTSAITLDSIDSLRFVPGSMGSNCGTLLIDNFAVYSESAENLSDEEKNTYIESEVAIKNITSEKASALTGSLSLPTAGGLVTWTSSNENVISSAGVVTRSTDINATVKAATLTAQWSGGSKVYNFAVIPTRYSKVDGFLADFEEGSDGSSISTTTVTDLTARKDYAGWGIIADSAPEISYKYDANKGLVGEFTNTEGIKNFGYSIGATQVGSQRYSTGFDLNVAELGEGSFTFTMNGAIAHHQLTFTKNTVKVYVDKTTKTYEITPDENGWIRVDIDSNWAARSQNIYINGEALTGTLKNMIYTSANTNGYGGDAYRTFTFAINGAGTVLLDNLTAAKHSESPYQPAIMADAGLKAVELFYSDKIITDGTSLQLVGPGGLYGTAFDISTSLANQTNNSWTNAAISYAAACVTEGVFSADKPAEYVLNVTSSAARANHYSASTTGTITIKGAPVVIGESDGMLTVSGNTANGTLVVAQYDASGKMTDAKVYTSFDNVTAPEGSYKAFFIIDMSKLAPGAFAIEK